MNEVQTQRIILENSKDLVNIFGHFYSEAFNQICGVDGLDLRKVEAFNMMLSDEQMELLKYQIDRLDNVSEQLGRTLPAATLMTRLYELLEKLREARRVEHGKNMSELRTKGTIEIIREDACPLERKMHSR